MGIKQEKRGTGRTHNMIMEALHIGSGRKGAIVIMKDQRNCEHAAKMVVPNCFGKDHHYWRVKLNGSTWSVLVGEAQVVTFRTVDWITKEFPNNGRYPVEWVVPGVELFIDHGVIEEFYGPALQAWTRYDNPHHKVNFHG